jgi:hypothetical protein
MTHPASLVPVASHDRRLVSSLRGPVETSFARESPSCVSHSAVANLQISFNKKQRRPSESAPTTALPLHRPVHRDGARRMDPQ